MLLAIIRGQKILKTYFSTKLPKKSSFRNTLNWTRGNNFICHFLFPLSRKCNKKWEYKSMQLGQVDHHSASLCALIPKNTFPRPICIKNKKPPPTLLPLAWVCFKNKKKSLPIAIHMGININILEAVFRHQHPGPMWSKCAPYTNPVARN